jgi:hypothetical protein
MLAITDLNTFTCLHSFLLLSYVHSDVSDCVGLAKHAQNQEVIKCINARYPKDKPQPLNVFKVMIKHRAAFQALKRLREKVNMHLYSTARKYIISLHTQYTACKHVRCVAQFTIVRYIST